MKLSIVHATRGRPKQALEMKRLWLAAADNLEEIEYIFGVDEDDRETLDALAVHRHWLAKVPRGILGGGVAAFNAAAEICTGSIIIGGSDDMHPIEHWDTILAARLPDTARPAVLLTSDGHRGDRLATLPIVTRGWHDKFGFLFPPDFRTVGPDLWLTERANRDGCLIDALDLVFEHRHPYYGKAAMDAGYERQNDPKEYEHMLTVLDGLLEKLPVSLCMIVGNEADLIVRCLDSAKDAFDELCLCRAVGTLPPDETKEKAAAWCEASGKSFVFGEYENIRQQSGVDHFGNARNASFNLATGYWTLWLDADDLLAEGACAKIRQAAANTRFDCHQFKYLMTTGAEIIRERLIKKGAGVWQNAVHETCHIKGIIGYAPQVVIRHAPPDGKAKSSAIRNLSLLEKEVHQFPRKWFYYQEELMHLGRKDEARAAAETALKILPADMVVERYEIFLNLIDLDTAQTEHWAFEAMKVEPLRREALAYLVQCAFNCGDIPKAVIFFNWLENVPIPKLLPWTHRAMWYGYGRNLLHARLLKAMGKDKESETVHAEYMKDPQYSRIFTALEKGQEI